MVNKQALRQQRTRQANITTLPSPYGGINTITQPGAMPATDALDMDNIFPDVGGVRARRGFEQYAGIGGTEPLKTLAEYNDGSQQKLLAATDSVIIDSLANRTLVQAVELDGSTDYYSRTSALTGIQDGNVGTFSCWVRSHDVSSVGTLLAIGDADTPSATDPGVRILVTDTAFLRITLFNDSQQAIFSEPITEKTLSINTWYHFLISWDVSNAGANKTLQVYIDDVDFSRTLGDNDGAVNYTPADVTVGAIVQDAGVISLWNGEIADLYFTDEFLDLSVEANRRKFINSSGFPVSLGDGTDITGTAPKILLRGPVSDFATNVGTGGDFTENGTPADTTENPGEITFKGGFTEGYWQVVNFNALQFWANGADTPQTFNGAFSDWTGSGPTVTDVIGCNVYRNRLYVWEDDTQDVWYGATNTIGGAFTKFQLSRVGTTGGKLLCCGNLTMDGGDGMDDMIVFIMSTGETLVYQGPDPSQFSLVGIFRIGKPLGVRAIRKVGPDLVVATQEDYVSLTEVLRARGRVRSKISGAARDAAAEFSTNAGWQVEFSPKQSMLVVNIPTSATTFEQHVQNTLTQAWTKYSDINSYCWTVFDGDLYFGGENGVVYKAETGNTDDGSAISWSIQQAWTDFGIPQNKRVIAYRLLTETDSSFTYTPQFGFDYQDPTGTQSITDSATRQDWQLGFGVGRSVSMKINGTSSDELKWFATDFKLEPAGLV